MSRPGLSAAGSEDSVVGRWRRKARKRGLGPLELAFPCVICSFTVVILIMCFCCCPLLLYRLRGEIGYDYLALLYFMLGLIVFGVIGESLLIARRRGRLNCCARVDQEACPSPAFSTVVVVAEGTGSLQEKPGVKAPLCNVHSRRTPHPAGPPPAYDFIGHLEKARPPAVKQHGGPRATTGSSDTKDEPDAPGDVTSSSARDQVPRQAAASEEQVSRDSKGDV